MYKVFTTDQILTVATGYMVAEDGVDAVYDLFSHLTGDPSITTLGYLAAADGAAEELKRQFPGLRDVRPPVFPEGASHAEAATLAREWVREQERLLRATAFDVLGGTVRARDYSFLDSIGSGLE